MSNETTTVNGGTQDLAGKNWFTTYTVFARPQGRPDWLGLDEAGREQAVAELDTLIAELGEQGVTVRGLYDVSGMRDAGDVMVWMYGQVPEDLQAAIRRMRRTRLLQGTTVVLSAMGADRMAEFNKEHVPAFAMGRKPLAWLCFYPFVRSYDWYLLDPKERARMLREHGKLGQDFPQVWANTTSAFGLNDWEWLLGLESPQLTDLVDMMRHLRDNETRMHVREEVPFYTGRRITTAEVPEVLA
ncbi:hydrogen peroxide-dependent heme synthase [Micrococcus sp.]|uniref:hydrogen peroxide-dependent heme synthase n=1 Tax=Micrococcus sp. TaxID=1271 RepID=UPI002A91AF10|nr:hydrogen peroxide-dependent heme synthase [Micrococcus sp.]MDY6054564.1 hydrogen peroxide-dependent heme synthase [Micrococcus sp.]